MQRLHSLIARPQDSRLHLRYLLIIFHLLLLLLSLLILVLCHSDLSLCGGNDSFWKDAWIAKGDRLLHSDSSNRLLFLLDTILGPQCSLPLAIHLLVNLDHGHPRRL